MQPLLVPALSTLLAATALAQGHATTATDFGVLATNGATAGFQSVAAGTPVGRGLAVHADAPGRLHTDPAAAAASSVIPFASDRGHGVLIREEGRARGTAAAAGTSGDAPGTAHPTPGAHGVALSFALAPGDTGVVTIAWDAHQGAGASIAGAVDVDGDGTPDWTGTGALSDRQTIPVTAGPNGVVLGIRTNGSAVAGTGDAGYAASLTVLFAPAGHGGVTCTWTPHGPQCLGQLAGTDSRSSTGELLLALAVTGAAANGIGVLALGDPAATPLNLPFGSCQLLIEPATAHLAVFTTDAHGDATIALRARAEPISKDFQAVTLGFVSGALGSTNALNLTCQ